MSLIYRTLKKKCDEKPELMPLRAQWEFDIRLLSSALRSVAISFPHYSLHDESHSNTIVIQIEKVLGEERIEKLSATNLWLILEAAYTHDLGMVIPDDEKRKTIQSEEFQRYLKGILDNKKHEFYEEAEIVNPNRYQKVIADSLIHWPLDVSRAITILIADYFRRHHATLSSQSISEPERIGLRSPRTGLIPKRLFKILGNISKSHGENQDFVLGLPFDEDGLGIEKCHPRFIAFLLRLGDLLDIDNGRFCPVMLSSCGRLPESSIHHVHKHAAIDHLSISREKIEIYATAKDYEEYSLLDSWFNYIKEEVKFVNQNLNKLIPDFSFGFFPNTDNLKVEFKDFELLSNFERPKIQIDQATAIALLQGDNLYSSEYTFIRELIQNSVDATFIKAFVLSRKKIDINNPASFFKSLSEDNDYQIEISVDKIQKNKVQNKIRFRIADKGIGMSKNEIDFLLKIGSSKENEKKQKILKLMPEWLKPSGYFSLGFQSVFSITDSVTLITKSLFDNTAYTIVFNEKGEKTIISKLPVDELDISSSFTSVEFEIEQSKIPDSYNFDMDNEDAKTTITNFDSLIDSEFPIQIANLKYEVSKYCKMYPVQIKVNETKVNKNELIYDSSFFDSKSNIELEIFPTFNFIPRSDLYYRDQKIETKKFLNIFPFIDFSMNIRNGNAGEFLVSSRDKISKKGLNEITKILFEILPKAMFEKYNKLKNETLGAESLQSLCLISLSAYISNLPNEVYQFGEEWKQFSLKEFLKETTHETTLGFLYSLDEMIVEFEESHLDNLNKITINNNSGNIIWKSVDRFIYLDFFESFVFKVFPNVYYLIDEVRREEGINQKVTYFRKILFSKNEKNLPFIMDEIIKNYFRKRKQTNSFHPEMKRFLIPLFDKKFSNIAFSYRTLASKLPYVGILNSKFQHLDKFLICPFTLENGEWLETGKEVAIENIFQLSEDKLSREEIERLYLEYTTSLMEIIKEDN